MNASLDIAVSGMSTEARGFTGPKEFVVSAVFRLMCCEQHHGTHHFMVTADGRGLVVNPSGADCITSWSENYRLREVFDVD